ncbi:hypothetical protein, partial [Chlorobium phaeovibrioides]|uniref:hypothetical protein n=1 Tax=Chlorobium phaeovibrioides TaxID=1094 RepID=UPI001F3541F4
TNSKNFLVEIKGHQCNTVVPILQKLFSFFSSRLTVKSYKLHHLGSSKELLPSSREPNVFFSRVPAKSFFIISSAAESTVWPPHRRIKELFPSSREPNLSLFPTSANCFGFLSPQLNFTPVCHFLTTLYRFRPEIITITISRFIIYH